MPWSSASPPAAGRYDVQQQARADDRAAQPSAPRMPCRTWRCCSTFRAGWAGRSTALRCCLTPCRCWSLPLPAVSAGCSSCGASPPTAGNRLHRRMQRPAASGGRAQGQVATGRYTATTGRASWMVQHAVEPLDEPGMTDGTGGDASALSELATTSAAARAHDGHASARAWRNHWQSGFLHALRCAALLAARRGLARAIADQLSVAIDNATTLRRVAAKWQAARRAAPPGRVGPGASASGLPPNSTTARARR